MLKNGQIQVIAFDADDTLWLNEPYFQAAEKQFCDMLEDFLPHHSISRELLQVEIANLELYGYGVKSFMLSMIETAIKISDGNLEMKAIERIVSIGRELLAQPVRLLDGVEEVLEALKGKYKLVMATKGDLLDQERKLINSGLESYFHHIEIVSEKKEAEYQKLVKHLDIEPSSFLMVGNSMKSDILPVVNIGGYGMHVPYHITWEHEKVTRPVEHPRVKQLNGIREVLEYV